MIQAMLKDDTFDQLKWNAKLENARVVSPVVTHYATLLLPYKCIW